jgi:hypothetical protein
MKIIDLLTGCGQEDSGKVSYLQLIKSCVSSKDTKCKESPPNCLNPLKNVTTVIIWDDIEFGDWKDYDAYRRVTTDNQTRL